MTTMRRGKFLLGALSGITVVANLDHVLGRALADAPLPGLPGASDRVLLLINLQGGNDGLNCIVPHGNPLYYQMRPTLAVPQSDVLRDRSERRLQSADARAQGDVRQGRRGRGANRRLPGPGSFALPVDRDLANRSPRSLRAHRVARPLPRRSPTAQEQSFQRCCRRAGAARSARVSIRSTFPRLRA